MAVWSTPPPQGTTIDTGATLVTTYDLLLAWRFVDDVVYDAINDTTVTVTGDITSGSDDYSSFDGTSEVEIGNLLTLGMSDGHGTVFMRIKPTSTDNATNGYRVFSYTGSSGTPAGSFGIDGNTTPHDVNLWSGTWRTMIDESASWAGAWHDVAITYETAAANDIVGGYFDGTYESGYVNATDTNRLEPDGVYAFGAEYTSNNYGDRYDGDVSVLLIFSGDISAADHATLSSNPWGEIWGEEPAGSGIIPMAHHYRNNSGSGL